MGYFPFFIDIENKNCLIVGGGEVALRKIKKLIPYRPDILLQKVYVKKYQILIIQGFSYIKGNF